jgi:hypothetical protein
VKKLPTGNLNRSKMDFAEQTPEEEKLPPHWKNHRYRYQSDPRRRPFCARSAARCRSHLSRQEVS